MRKFAQRGATRDCRLLGNVGIAAAIAEAQAKATAKACEKYEITKERVLGETRN